jgi:hypothetical protein
MLSSQDTGTHPLKDYPDELDSTPHDFAKHLFNAADCRALAEVLRKGPTKIGSFCAGMGTCYVVLNALTSVWNTTKAEEFGVKWACEHVFAVESDSWKRELIMKNMSMNKVFEKVEDFAAGRAFDFKSESVVDTLSLDVDIIVAGCDGFPCNANELGRHVANAHQLTVRFHTSVGHLIRGPTPWPRKVCPVLFEWGVDTDRSC